METQFDVELARSLISFEGRNISVVDDFKEIKIPKKDDYIGEGAGVLSLSGEWKLPLGLLVPASATSTPDHILWTLPSDVYPGGNRGPGGIKKGYQMRVFSDSRMESTGTLIVRSRTPHSYYSIIAFIHFRYNTTNHSVPAYGRAVVASTSGLRHGNNGYREYPYTLSNYWREGRDNFTELLRPDIDAWLHVIVDRER